MFFNKKVKLKQLRGFTYIKYEENWLTILIPDTFLTVFNLLTNAFSIMM